MTFTCPNGTVIDVCDECAQIDGRPAGSSSSGSSGAGSSAGGGGGSTSEPDQPSGMLLTPAQRIEKRGVNAAEACSSAIDHYPPVQAIEWCADALDAYRELGGANIGSRLAELARLVAFLENRRGAELLREGHCATAILLYRRAAATDPSVGAYARNAAGARCDRSTGKTPSDLGLPPPLPRRLAGGIVAIASPHDVAALVPVPADPGAWTQLAPAVDLTQEKVAFARTAYRQVVPLANDFVREAVWKTPLEAVAEVAGPPVSKLLARADDASGAHELGRKYRELVENVTAEIFDSAHEAVAILGGAGGSAEHVLDTPERVRAMVGQFVSDQLFEEVWSRTKAWGRGYLGAPINDALRNAVVPAGSARP
jgi:hypothetical protein